MMQAVNLLVKPGPQCLDHYFDVRQSQPVNMINTKVAVAS